MVAIGRQSSFRGFIEDLEDDAGAHRLVAFTHGEALSFFDRQLLDQLNGHGRVLTWHDHLCQTIGIIV